MPTSREESGTAIDDRVRDVRYTATALSSPFRAPSAATHPLATRCHASTCPEHHCVRGLTRPEFRKHTPRTHTPSRTPWHTASGALFRLGRWQPDRSFSPDSCAPYVSVSPGSARDARLAHTLVLVVVVCPSQVPSRLPRKGRPAASRRRVGSSAVLIISVGALREVSVALCPWRRALQRPRRRPPVRGNAATAATASLLPQIVRLRLRPRLRPRLRLLMPLDWPAGSSPIALGATWRPSSQQGSRSSGRAVRAASPCAARERPSTRRAPRAPAHRPGAP